MMSVFQKAKRLQKLVKKDPIVLEQLAQAQKDPIQLVRTAQIQQLRETQPREAVRLFLKSDMKNWKLLLHMDPKFANEFKDPMDRKVYLALCAEEVPLDDDHRILKALFWRDKVELGLHLFNEKLKRTQELQDFKLVIRECISRELLITAVLYYDLMCTFQFKYDSETYQIVMQLLTKLRQHESCLSLAQDLIKKHHKPWLSTWTMLLQSLYIAKSYDQVQYYYDLGKSMGIQDDAVHLYYYTLSLLETQHDPDRIYQLFTQIMTLRKTTKDYPTWRNHYEGQLHFQLLKYFRHHKRPFLCRLIYYDMAAKKYKRLHHAYSAIIYAYCATNNPEEAIGWMLRCLNRPSRVSKSTMRKLLKACVGYKIDRIVKVYSLYCDRYSKDPELEALFLDCLQEREMFELYWKTTEKTHDTYQMAFKHIPSHALWQEYLKLGELDHRCVYWYRQFAPECQVQLSDNEQELYDQFAFIQSTKST